MKRSRQIKILSINHKNDYYIFGISVQINDQRFKYYIYASQNDIPFKKDEISTNKLKKIALDKMQNWIDDSNGQLPKDKYRVFVNGGKITTNDIRSFLSIQKKASDLIRTNITISASLFEWAKAKAKKENTSFSNLVSRGLITLKDSDKEIEAWYKTQRAYFRKKLKDFGSLEVFHYLPNNYKKFATELLRSALQNAQLNRTGWPIGVYLTGGDTKPLPQEDGIKAEYPDSSHLILDYWYAKNMGEFYFSRNLDSDSGHGKAQPKTSLYFDTLVWRVAEALEHCLKYYNELGVNEEERVKLRIALHGLANRKLSAWNPMRAVTLSHYICGSDSSTWDLETSIKKLKDNLDDVIYESVKKLLIMFDFFVPNRQVVQSILDKEYRKSTF